VGGAKAHYADEIKSLHYAQSFSKFTRKLTVWNFIWLEQEMNYSLSSKIPPATTAAAAQHAIPD
jgi:hypothetical protein